MPKKIPNRMCVACRQMKPKKELIRVVADSSGAVFLDRTGRANGRGAYLCTSTDCLEKAKKSKSLERSLKQVIPLPLWDELEILGKKEENG
jgi:uncharacterized protein